MYHFSFNIFLRRWLNISNHVLSILFFLGGTFNATANEAWTTHKEPEDVFGLKGGYATVGDAYKSLIVQCSGNQSLQIAYIESNNGNLLGVTHPAKILVKVDDNPLISATGQVSDWNNRYHGASISVDSAPITAIAVIQMMLAKKTISIGYELGDGTRDSYTVSVRGSTKAIKGTLDHCGISYVPPV